MPFKSAEEKRAYILAHKDLFEALGLEFNDKVVDDLVKKPDKDETYKKANEFQKKIFTSQKVRDQYRTKLPPILSGTSISRFRNALYDYSGTPEADRWNKEYSKMFESNETVRQFFRMAARALLTFDSSALAKSFEESKQILFENPKVAFMCFGANDLGGLAEKYLNSDDPEEVMLATAVLDRNVFLQSFNNLSFQYKYESSKLFTILPDKLTDKQMEVLGQYMLKNYQFLKEVDDDKKDLTGPEETTDGQALNALYSSYTLNSDYEKDRAIMQQMVDKKLIGPEGLYHRAYIETSKGKKYITLNDVYKAYKANKDVKKIKIEEFSAEDKKLMDKAIANSRTYGSVVFKSEASKRKSVETLKPVISMLGKDVSKKSLDDMVNSKANDQDYLDAKQINEMLDNSSKLPFSINEKVHFTDVERMVGGLYLPGDSKEVNSWNENIRHLAQSEEGLKQLAAIAAKKLLSVDLKVFAEENRDKRIQYMKEHPFETNLLFISRNIFNAYSASLSPAERANNPVIRAMQARIALYEDIKGEKGYLEFKASEFGNLVTDATYEKAEAIVSMDLSRYETEGDPETKEILSKARGSLSQLLAYEHTVSQNKEYRSTVNSLVSDGTIGPKTLYQRIYANVKIEGTDKTEKQEFTLDKMINAIKDKKLTKADFIFEEIPADDRKKIEEFMQKTPDSPTTKYTKAQKEKLNKLVEYRTNFSQNTINFVTNCTNSFPSLEQIEDKELSEMIVNAGMVSSINKRSQALAKAIEYATSHKKYDSDQNAIDKLDIALATIAVLDIDYAKKIVKDINEERKSHYYRKPLVDLKACLKRFDVKPGRDIDKEVYKLDEKVDTRVFNICELYEHFTDHLSPWYISNSDKYDKMLDTMRALSEYAAYAKNPDKKTIEAMLKDVIKTTEEYLNNSKDAHYDIARNRKAAAMAALAVLAPDKAEKLMFQYNKEGKSWVNKISQELGKTSGKLTVKDLLKYEITDSPLPKEEKLKQMNDDIISTVNKIRNPETRLRDKIDLTAEYIIKKRAYNLQKNGKSADKENKVSEEVAKKEAEVKLLAAPKVEANPEVEKKGPEIKVNEAFKKATDSLKAGKGVIEFDLDDIELEDEVKDPVKNNSGNVQEKKEPEKKEPEVKANPEPEKKESEVKANNEPKAEAKEEQAKDISKKQIEDAKIKVVKSESFKITVESLSAGKGADKIDLDAVDLDEVDNKFVKNISENVKEKKEAEKAKEKQIVVEKKPDEVKQDQPKLNAK